MLRPEFVRRKLQLITDDLGYLSRYRGVAHAELVEDFAALATVERLLERIVMRAIDVNQHLLAALSTGEEERTTRLTYRDTFLRLADFAICPAPFAEAIAPSAGLRSILVHDYNDVDRRVVHAAIATCLEQYPRYVDHVTRFLDRRQPSP